MGTMSTITNHKNLLFRLTLLLRKILINANITSNTHKIKKINPKVPLIAEVIIYMALFFNIHQQCPSRLFAASTWHSIVLFALTGRYACLIL